MAIQELIERSGPRKLLALDGGGIRGLISVEVLSRLETLLQGGRGEDFRLADAFDYVAGTSTGAILATCIALGMRVDEIRAFYRDSGTDMFDKASMLTRVKAKYRDEKLAEKLKSVTGEEHEPRQRPSSDAADGGHAQRQYGLAVADLQQSKSPVQLALSCRARQGMQPRPPALAARARQHGGSDLLSSGGHRRRRPKPFVMVDGGVTPYNNPAFMLFLMATAEPYRLCWPRAPPTCSWFRSARARIPRLTRILRRAR